MHCRRRGIEQRHRLAYSFWGATDDDDDKGTARGGPAGFFAAGHRGRAGAARRHLCPAILRIRAHAGRIAVGKQYNDLLSSGRREDVLAARDLITAKPALVTPMVMMVLAIRLYDVGLRDDAVFWFYVAKERYVVMSEVLDVKSQLLAQADDAVRSFSTLAGPVINGYAFCDLARQKDQHTKAIEWVEANPYEVMFMARAPALPGDRAENARRAVINAKDRAARERAYFDDAKTREAYYAKQTPNSAGNRQVGRRENRTDF